jgi:hypothetical protein
MTVKLRLAQLQSSVIKMARLHFGLTAILAVQIIIYDAWNLIPPDVVMRRWLLVALLLVVSTIVWYLARVVKDAGSGLYTGLIFALILADILVASFSVYMERGMASRSVALFAVPIIVAAVLYSRAAIMATAALCVAAYVATTISYFVLNFNEGYKIELYGEVGFYSALFVLLAMSIWAVIRPQKSG